MNLLTKPMPWMVASLLAAASIFGQTQSQNQSQGSCGHPPQNTCGRPPTVCKPQPKCGPLQEPQVPTVCAYNAPAEINIGIQGDYDFFASASFLYWQPSQDNMAIALTDSLPTPYSPGVTSFHGSFVEMDFDYKPGFNVALGLNLQHDNWDLFLEYTRVHGTHTKSSSGDAGGPLLGSIFPTLVHSDILYGDDSLEFESVHGKFKNNLDFLDLDMGRTYYVGTCLIFRSAIALRGAWITENLSVHYNTNEVGTWTHDQVNTSSRAHSWAVGPRVGLTTQWLFSNCGFRIYGKSYGDILYTKYKLKDRVDAIATDGEDTYFITHDRVGVLRTHLELELGLGWGTYLDNNNWHIDLMLGYGFQVFFDQNMFRQFLISSVPNGNLYVQGLNATMRLDF